ncbi:MAG: hypothetical protein AAGI88_00300 [Pseudomonadota bacterium]
MLIAPFNSLRDTYSYSSIVLLAFALWVTLPAHSTDLSPSLRAKVQRIAGNIQETQQRLDTEGAAALGNELKAKQLGDRIQSYGSALEKMPSDDDPVLLEAKAAHRELVNSYNALIGGSATTAASAAGAAPSQAAGAASEASGKALVSGQRVRVQKLTRDITALGADLTTTGPSSFQDARNVERYRVALEKYGNELQRYTEYPSDADVIAAARAYQQTQQALSGEFQRAQAQLAELGDVQGTLAQLRASLQESVVPGTLYAPITPEEAQALVTARADTKERAQVVLAEIERMRPLAYLEVNNPGTLEQGAPFDQNDVRSMERVAQENIVRADGAYSSTVSQLERQLGDMQSGQLEYFERILADVDKNRSAFLAEGADQQFYSDIGRMQQIPDSLAEVQQANGEKVSLAVRARQEKLDSLRAMYAESRQQILGEYTLPKAASSDKQRLAIAAEVLANPSYEYGTHGPIVLTTEAIETRSKEVSRDTIKDVDLSLSGTITWSGTRETWQYDWDEFKFATPLKHDNGDWYVWWITAKYFRSGASTTPLNRWVSGGATQGDLILERNFR